MPKSKRQKVVSLTKTEKHVAERKKTLVTAVQAALEEYAACYVISHENERSCHFAEIRQALKDSRIFLGKNSVMQVALGKSEDAEHVAGAHALAPYLTGNCGLLLTSRSHKEITKFFSEYSVPDFARSGATLDKDYSVLPGPLPQFPSSMIQQFVKLGLPVELNNGVVTLRGNSSEPYVLAHKGVVLTPEQAQLLKLFEIMTVEFKVGLVAVLRKGKVQVLRS